MFKIEECHLEQLKKVCEYFLESNMNDDNCMLASNIHMMSSLMIIEELLDQMLDILDRLVKLHGN